MSRRLAAARRRWYRSPVRSCDADPTAHSQERRYQPRPRDQVAVADPAAVEPAAARGRAGVLLGAGIRASGRPPAGATRIVARSREVLRGSWRMLRRRTPRGRGCSRGSANRSTAPSASTTTSGSRDTFGTAFRSRRGSMQRRRPRIGTSTRDRFDISPASGTASSRGGGISPRSALGVAIAAPPRIVATLRSEGGVRGVAPGFARGAPA